MAREVENDCVGCEVCRHCGRNHDYRVAYCDKCGCVIEEIECDDDILTLGKKDYCPECFVDELSKDMTIEECILLIEDIKENKSYDLEYEYEDIAILVKIMNILKGLKDGEKE